MTKVGDYQEALANASDPEAYLLAHSGLPGPRGNIELAQAATRTSSAADLRRWAKLTPEQAPTGTATEFLSFCGVLGLGEALVEGGEQALAELRRHASDPRWRVREAVAMALQRWGEADFEPVAAAMRQWATGSSLERRAACAALCEPALLTTPERVGETLAVLAEATTKITDAPPEERRTEQYKALRKGLGYCWSVAVAADPELGRPAFEELAARAAAGGDSDLAWLVRENLRTRRLERLDPEWTSRLLERLQPSRQAR
jgi:hypothetical protein